jgi:hypothetical protein
MKCIFYVDRKDGARRGPKHRLAGAEVVLEDPSIGPVRISGVAIWTRRDGVPGEMSVTFPATRVERSGSRGYIEYVKPADTEGRGIKALRAAILKAFREQHAEAAVEAEAVPAGAGV